MSQNLNLFIQKLYSSILVRFMLLVFPLIFFITIIEGLFIFHFSTEFYLIIVLNVILFIIIFVMFYVYVFSPIHNIYQYLSAYYKYKGSEKVILKKFFKDDFGDIYKLVRDIITKAESDQVKTLKEDQIQNDFILLSGHILRTPISSLVGYMDILKSSNKDKSLDNLINNINLSLTKLQQLEENIISITTEENNIIKGDLTSVSVKDVMKSVYDELSPLAIAKNIKMILDLSQIETITINAHKESINHALKNLVDNAIKFTPEGGNIRIYGTIKDNDIIVSVSDTGRGLSPEEVEVIYKKFSRISSALEYNSDGLGIGLFIVKRIAEMNNGETWVDSIKGNGSVFNMKFPILAK